MYIRSKSNFLRPPMVTTYEFSNVLIEGVSFSNPPFWTIMPAFTDNITITGITIENPDNSPDTDGIDPSSCKNVRISNCHNMVYVKTSSNRLPYLKLTNCSNILVTNCYQSESIPVFITADEKSENIYIANNVLPGTVALHNSKGKNIYTQNNILSR
ncbi:MAG: glycosyl hydrolase family 28 protein [Bacteroidales bacterium]